MRKGEVYKSKFAEYHVLGGTFKSTWGKNINCLISEGKNYRIHRVSVDYLTNYCTFVGKNKNNLSDLFKVKK